MKLREEERLLVCPRISDEQERALEEFVRRSPDMSDFAKKAVIFALRKADNLTRPVSLSLPELPSEETLLLSHCIVPRARQMQDGVHDINSVNGRTFIYLFFKALGTDFGISHHDGVHEKSIYLNPGRTIWVSPIFFDRDAEVLDPSFEAIERVDISKDLFWGF